MMAGHEDEVELSQARILGARNSSTLPARALTAVREATRISTIHIAVYRNGTPVTFRYYAVTCTYKMQEEIKITNRDGSEGKITRPIERQEETHLWEIQGIRRTRPETSGSWVYADPRSAASAFAYLLMTPAGMWEEDEAGEIVDLRDMLGKVLQLAGVRTTGAVPSVPLDDSDTKATRLAELATTAVEAKKGDVSPRIRKRIAVALHEAGERNIRRISSLTGLSRETVYKALQDEGVER
ncbi:hypothetical protein ACWCSD_03575 [Nonomuraea sp. NPDC001684]